MNDLCIFLMKEFGFFRNAGVIPLPLKHALLFFSLLQTSRSCLQSSETRPTGTKAIQGGAE